MESFCKSSHILAAVSGQVLDMNYLLEGHLQNSDLMLAKALVTAGKSIPIQVINPTSKPVILYKGTNVASLLGVDEVICCNDSVPISFVQQCFHDATPILEVFQSLLENTSLSVDQQDILLSLFMEYADVLQSLMTSWVVLMCCNTRFSLEMYLLSSKDFVGYHHRRGKKYES